MFDQEISFNHIEYWLMYIYLYCLFDQEVTFSHVGVAVTSPALVKSHVTQPSEKCFDCNINQKQKQTRSKVLVTLNNSLKGPGYKPSRLTRDASQCVINVSEH